MTERKSRFGDRSALPDDPALHVLQLRPRGVADDPAAPVTYPGRLAAEDQQALVVRLQKAREEANGSRAQLEAERAERERERNEGLLLLVGRSRVDRLDGVCQPQRTQPLHQGREVQGVQGKHSPQRPGHAGARAARRSRVPRRRTNWWRAIGVMAAIRELNRELEGGFKILVRVDAKAAELVDLCLKMYRENADREDLSAHETGSMFANWLQAGVCKTQREIAALTGLKENTVSQYLTIAGLPPEVLAAFGDLRAIAVRWSTALAKACKEHLPETLARVKKVAKQHPRPDAEAVYKLLTADLPAGRKTKRGSKKSDMVYVDDKVLFKIALKDKHLTFSRWQVEP